MKPFQPTVVLGFSKYTRMTSSSVSETSAESFFSFSAYSIAASISWIEQGPTMRNSLGSSRLKILFIASLAFDTVASACSDAGTATLSWLGVIRVSSLSTFKSSTFKSVIEKFRILLCHYLLIFFEKNLLEICSKKTPSGLRRSGFPRAVWTALFLNTATYWLK